jgi:hypothetical protein
MRWFEGNFQDYEADKMRRLGQDSIIPHRLKYRKFKRQLPVKHFANASTAAFGQ